MFRFVFILIATMLFSGCSDYSLEKRGDDGQPCFNNGKCNDHFVCVKGMCADPSHSLNDEDNDGAEDTDYPDENGIQPDDNTTKYPDEEIPDEIEENNDETEQIISKCNLGEICWHIVPTQQRRCFNETGSVGCASIGDSLFGQDGNYAPSGNRGFENIQIGDKYFVFDNLTEMLWNKKSSEAKLNHSDAVKFCDDLNKTSEGEKNNWRLPYFHELVSIYHFDESVNPAVDGFFFPDVKSGRYWTKNKLGYNSYYYVDFSGANQFYIDDETKENYAFCVSSDYEYDSSRKFNRWNPLSTGEVTVEDNLTGLIWMKPYYDYRLWKDALQYCEKLEFAGENDWRLPNVNELHSLTTYGLSYENQSSFPDLGTGFYWTSTTNANDINKVWMAEFKYGILNPTLLKNKNENQIRTICVRNKE